MRRSGSYIKIVNVGTIHRMHRHAFAARDVSDDRFAANRIATSRAIDQHVALALARVIALCSPPKTRRTTLLMPPGFVFLAVAGSGCVAPPAASRPNT